MSKSQILEQFSDFSLEMDGIGGWLRQGADERIFARLDSVHRQALTKVQLNQLLALGHEAPVSDEFFRYYWLEDPDDHPYPTANICRFDRAWLAGEAIGSLEHLKWGLYRLFFDSLLFFGNVRTGYRKLRALNEIELRAFFSRRRFDTAAIKKRGPALPLDPIPKDDRYLISEMACKSYGDNPASPGELKRALLDALEVHLAAGGGRIPIRDLLQGGTIGTKYKSRQGEFMFAADDVLDDQIASAEDLESRYGRIAERFHKARTAALANTDYYLSMVNDLDVYVATSMRTRADFRSMADDCDKIFSDSRLKDMNLRYFDPTVSAAEGHEDKGLIECLMVKCAKVLVYCAGERESYGKDAEAAMALSLGKPVIFYCTGEQRSRFYKEVHPLSRLIEFSSGVAVGSMVTDKIDEVTELLRRIFENKMEYALEHPKKGYLRLKEKLTGSVVRLQTNDRLLAETFWNHYHNREAGPRRD